MARARHTPKKLHDAPKGATAHARQKPKIELPPVEEIPGKEEESAPGTDEPARCWKRTAIFVLLSFVAGVLNSYNGYSLFENDCYFSHLSNLEREMTFRTEMGLYYSYFKVLAHAPTISDGFHELLSNNRTEYPTTINTLKRFNLYPELVIGIAYRIFNQTVDSLGIDAKQCWTVNRGENQNAVESCYGLGDPAMFYMTSVYLWNFLSGASLAALAGLLSDSFLGTILSCALYFFNFDESTRVQWTPPLRESFAYPLLILQMYLTSKLLRSRIDVSNCVVYVIISTSCLLCWQFSQFVLATEISCLFLVFVLHDAIERRQLQYISCMHLCTLFISHTLLFLNDMLFCSFYTAVVVACIISSQTRFLTDVKWSKMRVFAQILFFAVITIAVKVLFTFFLRVEDDSHVWGLLRSKISDYRDFDTMLYTCAPEFDYLQFDYVKAVGPTLGVVLLVLTGIIARALFRRSPPFTAEFLYNFYQCLVFGVMAYTFMRLKVLLTPHLCVLSSVVLCPRYFSTGKVRFATAIGLLAILVLPGMHSVVELHSHTGEYVNPDLEELMIFIDDYAEPEESFAGPMPLMANIMLSTGRPIVNHPHYENSVIRKKTETIYTLLSRKPMKEVQNNLKSVHARYVVIPRTWCLGKTRSGCSLPAIWDELDPENRNRPLVCERLMKDDTEKLFETVFQNDEYTMLSLV